MNFKLNRLPKEAVTVPSLLEFKEHVDNAFSHGLVLGSPSRSRDLDSMSLMDLFQLGRRQNHRRS